MKPPPRTSRLSGLHHLLPMDRAARVAEAASLDDGVACAWATPLDPAVADRMVENVVGVFGLPLGIATNLRVNGRDVLVPMVVEEASVVAAVSGIGRLTRDTGGVEASADPSVMIGQVHIPDVVDADELILVLEGHRDRLESAAGALLPDLQAVGGGFRGLEIRHVRYDEPGWEPEEMVVLHFLVDCVDAMGANMVNTVAEALAGVVQDVTGVRTGLRILSNLADRRLARARVRIPFAALASEDVEGQEVARRVAGAWRFAWADPYRAATHNKGILNGIDAVALATGNDWRAVEAGAHAWAAREGTYRPLSSWRLDPAGHLVGHLELPLAVGVVGGSTRVHPAVRANLDLLGVEKASELAEVMVAVGLAQNLAALRALATSGIQRGHMRLHARNVAVSAGARAEEVDAVVARLVADADYALAHARRVLEEVRRHG